MIWDASVPLAATTRSGGTTVMLTVLPITPLMLWLMSPSLSRSRKVAVTPAMASALLMSGRPFAARDILPGSPARGRGRGALRRRAFMHRGHLDAPDADMDLVAGSPSAGAHLGQPRTPRGRDRSRSLLRGEQRLEVRRGSEPHLHRAGWRSSPPDGSAMSRRRHDDRIGVSARCHRVPRRVEAAGLAGLAIGPRGDILGASGRAAGSCGGRGGAGSAVAVGCHGGRHRAR